MKISYNWLKWYIPDAPQADKLADIFTYHVAEVESSEKVGDDTIFEIKILPNRAHDLLSHQGIAREISSLLNIKFVDPAPKYKVPESKPTNLKIDADHARRYMGRIVRNIKVGPSPEWVVKHLASVGQRSINNIVDATNITMFDCGQPCHAFDLDKIKGSIIVRNAKAGDKIVTLDGRDLNLTEKDVVIADDEGALAIAGVKGGKRAEVDENTENILLEVANFFPVLTRRTARRLGISTDASKRFENDLSPELCDLGMLEISALIAEYGGADFEEIVDMYMMETFRENKNEYFMKFSAEKISKILGIEVSVDMIEEILNRYNILYKHITPDKFEAVIPTLRMDLSDEITQARKDDISEDMAEEIGRVLGYDKIKSKISKINFKPKPNEVYSNILWARNKLLSDGYSEVMTSTFRNSGEVSVLASASDKTFLRTNLTDGLKESIKLNQMNAPLLGIDQTRPEVGGVKIFEIGTVFKKDGEQMNVCCGDKKEIKEMTLNEFCKSASPMAGAENSGAFALGDTGQGTHDALNSLLQPRRFKMWSLFPFIARDVAVWVPEGVTSEDVEKIIKDNIGDMVVRGPELFDEFKKDGKVSYAFKLVFQSPDRTLTDAEVNEIMTKIANKITENNGWQVR